MSVAILAQAYLASSFAPHTVAAHNFFIPALTPPAIFRIAGKTLGARGTTEYDIYHKIIPIIVYDDPV